MELVKRSDWDGFEWSPKRRGLSFSKTLRGVNVSLLLIGG